MQRALPIAARDKLRGVARAAERHRARLAELRPRLLVVQFGGAVGTRRDLDGKGAAVAAELARRLGLGDAPCWHVERDAIGEFGGWLGLVAARSARSAQDCALMAQNEIGEIRLAGGGGSSAMPHKVNPVGAEMLVALARFAACSAELCNRRWSRRTNVGGGLDARMADAAAARRRDRRRAAPRRASVRRVAFRRGAGARRESLTADAPTTPAVRALAPLRAFVRGSIAIAHPGRRSRGADLGTGMLNDPSRTVAAAAASHDQASLGGHAGGNFWILALGSFGVVFGDIGTSPLYALQTALGQFKDTGVGVVEVDRHRLADRLGAADRRHRQIRAVPDAGRQQGRGRHSLARRAGADRARQTHGRRVPARRRRGGAVLRRRDHHAGDFGAVRARRPEAGQRRPRALSCCRRRWSF